MTSTRRADGASSSRRALRSTPTHHSPKPSDQDETNGDNRQPWQDHNDEAQSIGRAVDQQIERAARD